MALTHWDHVLETVVQALAGWGADLRQEGQQFRELRDFGMDFQVKDLNDLPSEFAVPYDQAVQDRYRTLAGLLDSQPLSTQALIQFSPDQEGNLPDLLQLAFSLRHGELDLTVVAREHRFPDRFTADVGPALHLQERLAGALGVQRGRCTYFALGVRQDAG